MAQAVKIKMTEDQIASATSGSTEFAWLAGIVEGEASLEASGTLRIQMTDEDVMRRLSAIFGTRLSLERPRREHWTPTWCTRVTGQRAIQLLEPIEHALGQRRRQQVRVMREAIGERRIRSIERGATGNGRGFVPPTRMARNLEIARRLIADETGTVLAAEYGMTHQNVYFIGKKYKGLALAACPRGEGSACKAEYAGSNPAAASK